MFVTPVRQVICGETRFPVHRAGSSSARSETGSVSEPELFELFQWVILLVNSYNPRVHSMGYYLLVISCLICFSPCPICCRTAPCSSLWWSLYIDSGLVNNCWLIGFKGEQFLRWDPGVGSTQVCLDPGSTVSVCLFYMKPLLFRDTKGYVFTCKQLLSL